MTGNTEQKPPAEKKPKREFFRLLGIVSTVGINLVVCTFIGFAIGYYLDGFFETFPWFTIIFLILGIATGFRYLFKVAQKAGKNGDSQKSN